MKINARGTFINKSMSEYEFNGRSGISRKARFLVDNEIFETRFNDDSSIALFNSLPDSSCAADLVFALTSPKEKLSIKLIEFKVAK